LVQPLRLLQGRTLLAPHRLTDRLIHLATVTPACRRILILRTQDTNTAITVQDLPPTGTPSTLPPRRSVTDGDRGTDGRKLHGRT